MAKPFDVTETTVLELPKQGGLEGTVSSSVKNVWFLDTWDYSNSQNAVRLFPYKLLQIEGQELLSSFTLPISPQQLNISTPFAIVTTPTLNGIVEEHNSVRFKEIEIAGTMGVFPVGRDRSFSSFEVLNLTGLLDVVESVSATVPLVQLLRLSKELLVEGDLFQSGYANLHILRKFLESYAEEKKTKKNLRLVFASYKDNQYYYVVPNSFVVRRSASNPMEYEYSLSLKSWGTYNPNAQIVIPPDKNHGSEKNWAALIGYSIASLPTAASSVLSGASQFAGANAIGATGLTIFSNLTNYPGWASLSTLATNRLNPSTPPPTQTQVAALAAQVNNASSSFANSIGLSPVVSGVTNPLTGEPTVSNQTTSTQQVEPSPAQMNALFSLNDLRINLDHLQASLMAQAPTQASPLDYVAGLASKSGIAFQTSVSKYPVSMPANATLEHLAAKYLNDPNRWMEIATLNGLQQPYIDNTGVDVPFLFDGARNKVAIKTDALGIGKYVTLSSGTVPRKTYGVVSYTQNGYYFEVTLDNDPDTKLPNSDEYDDLSRYTVADKATLHYYAPNTVHAGQLLYIPSDEPSNINEFNTSQIPSLKQYEDEIRVGGVDLLLTAPSAEEDEGKVIKFPNTLDLVVQDNDVALSYGITNLKQALYLILFTPQGSILQHPDFGIPSTVGQSNADVNYDSYTQTIKSAILQDRAFSDVEFITSSLNGPVLTVSLGVRIAQVNKVLPIAFDINLKGA